MNPKVLITVLACNDYSYTKTCINRLFKATEVDFDLLLIDNSFNQDQRVETVYQELFEEYGDRLKFQKNGCNLGIAVSLNNAFKYMIDNKQYTHFAQFHTDTYVGPKYLENLLLTLDRYNIEAVAPLEQNDHTYFPKVCSDWDRKVQENKKFFETSEQLVEHTESIFNYLFETEAEEIQKRYQYTLIPDAFSFSSYLFTRNFVEYVQAFDESFFPGGGEDRDFINRAQKNTKFKFYKTGNCFVLHWGSITYIHSGNIEGRLASEFSSKQIDALPDRDFYDACIRTSCKHNADYKCMFGTMLAEFYNTGCPYYDLDPEYYKKNGRLGLCKQ